MNLNIFQVESVKIGNSKKIVNAPEPVSTFQKIIIDSKDGRIEIALFSDKKFEIKESDKI